eukprot:TRINITY_DN50349_c0_g1_i1.p1 TRINITY_DN50349_c0_g1~~TRINITY_DN50349_c0_g1_i1.p1  ORF type:complete len:862 (+),score=324.47 TRINITY_DN50349_c0_g1_i1:79-2586(+)
MRAALLLWAVAASAGPVAVVNEYPRDPVAAATALIGRLLPDHAAAFELELIPKQGDKHVSGVGSKGGKVLLQGSGGVELASALNWYLNDFLNVTVDWNTYGEGQLPAAGATLPLPPTTVVQRTRQVPWSYYMNVCTMGYSLAFVSWEYWEKHIDWMALNGINMPLAFVGQEWLWLKVFEEYNITFPEMQTFISGPAFLPWFRMGNMQGWGGPITMNWLTQRRDLQLKILARMRGLGMTPALSAFAGHVPAAFAAKHPQAKVSKSPPWAGFSGQYGQVSLLEATDPLYTEIGKKFIEVQSATFGTDHIYQCDTYNELTPPTSDPAYLRAASAAVYEAMAAGDAGAIWLMQGWLFQSTGFWKEPQIKAYLGGVDNSKMWILDLFGSSKPIWSKTGSFYGKPFIFCTLLNFGGQQGLTGNLPQTVEGLEKTRQANSTVLGVGITMEGIWQNYPAFELTLALAWLPSASTDATAWLTRYGDRRYGGPHPGAAAAWAALQPVYAGHGGGFGSAISTYPGNQLKATVEDRVRHRIGGVTRDLHPRHALAVDCTYGSELKNSYIPGCSNGKAGGCDSEATLAAAEAACSADQHCTGVTHSGGRYELRGGETPLMSPSGESSWIVTNMADCHPGYVPPGAVWARAAKGLLDDKAALAHVASYRFDLVDVVRQGLSAVFSLWLAEFQAAFRTGNKTLVAAYGKGMLELIDDYDTLLSSDSNFMLGPWIAWAREWGADEDEQQWLEFNARNQITLWGDHGEINDYAKKEWGGLVRDYYRARWEILFAQANRTAPAWDPNVYYNTTYNQVELAFSKRPFVDKKYPTAPEHDAVQVATVLYAKYLDH